MTAIQYATKELPQKNTPNIEMIPVNTILQAHESQFNQQPLLQPHRHFNNFSNGETPNPHHIQHPLPEFPLAIEHAHLRKTHHIL